MTEQTSALDLVPADEDVVSTATKVWSSLNLDLKETALALDDAGIAGSASVSISGSWEGAVRLDFAPRVPGTLVAVMLMMEPGNLTDGEVWPTRLGSW